jgi:hypothetical protein
MPRRGSLATDIVEILRKRPGGATLADIRRGLTRRRGEVLPHSVRRAIYGHLEDNGERLFIRVGEGGRSGRYALRTPDRSKPD